MPAVLRPVSVKVPTECAPLDALLEGGLEPGAVTLVYGEPASGKTNLCLQAARHVVSTGLRTAYVDTEGVSFERLRQVAGASFPAVMKQVLFSTPSSLSDQERWVEKATQVQDAGLIIVDSFNFYYRLELDADSTAASRSLLAQLGALQGVCRLHRIPALITAQVYGAKDDEVLPFGGRLMGHVVKTVLEFKREPNGVRRAIIRKHRAIPEGRSTIFKITDQGLE